MTLQWRNCCIFENNIPVPSYSYGNMERGKKKKKEPLLPVLQVVYILFN